MSDVRIVENNAEEIRDSLNEMTERIMTIIGGKIEGYAKRLCPVGTPESTGKKGYRGSTLKNSITFDIDEDEAGAILRVGTNVEYAPYVELGTGPYFEPPPEWETFDTPAPSGEGTGYVHARPFLRPAITDHLDQFGRIIRRELRRG